VTRFPACALSHGQSQKKGSTTSSMVIMVSWTSLDGFKGMLLSVRQWNMYSSSRSSLRPKENPCRRFDHRTLITTHELSASVGKAEEAPSGFPLSFVPQQVINRSRHCYIAGILV
jgi:hypothetical protein